MLKSLALAAATLLAPVALADHDDLGSITGEHIDLKMHDHAIAGSVHGFVLFGHLDEGAGAGELTMKRDGRLVKATFGKTDSGKVGGVIASEVDGAARETALWFVRLDRPTNTYHLTLGDQPFTVRVEAPDFQNNHFIDPTFIASLPDGREVRFTMDGEACYGFSLHLIFQVLGAYIH